MQILVCEKLFWRIFLDVQWKSMGSKTSNRLSLDRKKKTKTQWSANDDWIFIFSSSWHFLIHNTDNTGIVGDRIFIWWRQHGHLGYSSKWYTQLRFVLLFYSVCYLVYWYLGEKRSSEIYILFFSVKIKLLCLLNALKHQESYTF